MTKSEPLPEGTVIMAEDQFGGRGQLSSKWLSQPGKNLTFSLLLCPSFLDPQKQFLLNIAVSTAINEILTQIIGEGCKIKWPNDIFYQDRKLGGVLIENIISGTRWKYAIIGVGINVNQTTFEKPIKNVTSLKKITGSSFVRRSILNKICHSIEVKYLELKNNTAQQQYKQYISRLYRYQQAHPFEIDGTFLNGKIIDVDLDGHLVIDIQGEKRKYGLKEIKYILPDF